MDYLLHLLHITIFLCGNYVQRKYTTQFFFLMNWYKQVAGGGRQLPQPCTKSGIIQKFLNKSMPLDKE